MGMKRKSRLSLQLFPLLPASGDDDEFCTNHSLTCSSIRNRITNFHHAQAGVYDASELQALAILWLARAEMEPSKLGTSCLQFQSHRPYGLSLKKSLNMFLQNRRNRTIKQPASL